MYNLNLWMAVTAANKLCTPAGTQWKSASTAELLCSLPNPLGHGRVKERWTITSQEGRNLSSPTLFQQNIFEHIFLTQHSSPKEFSVSDTHIHIPSFERTQGKEVESISSSKLFCKTRHFQSVHSLSYLTACVEHLLYFEPFGSYLSLS